MGSEQAYGALHFICKTNNCRSRIARGIMQEWISTGGLEGRLEARSSGILVDDFKAWGKTKEFKWDSIIKVLKVAYNNGIHSMTGYKAFVEGIIANEQQANGMHDNDAAYRRDVNVAAAHVWHLVEMVDTASAMLVLAEHNIVYPAGEPRQFAPDNSSLYVPMEEKHVEKVAALVLQAGEKGKVIPFEDFITGEMGGSLAAIKYKDGMLNIAGHRKIYRTIKEGCDALECYVIRELMNIPGVD